ncbi:MAG: hypothetical protein JXA20_04310 [Spirochaetes bacterium]|nr:hypothetical protein [Spirochaetota bacterium]
MKNVRNGIIENATLSVQERERQVAGVDSLKYADDQFILFAIVHTKMVIRQQGATKIYLVDGSGKKVGDVAAVSTYKVLSEGGGYHYVTQWIVMASRPLERKNYSDLPVVLKAEFFGNQRKEYMVLDK